MVRRATKPASLRAPLPTKHRLLSPSVPEIAVPIHNGQQESASHCRRHRLMRSVGLALVCPNPRALRPGRRVASVSNASISVRWQSRRHGEPSAVGRADDTSRTCVCLDRLLSGYEGHRRCRGEADKPWVNEGWGHSERADPPTRSPTNDTSRRKRDYLIATTIIPEQRSGD